MDDLIDRQNAIDVLELLADKMSDEGKTVMAQAVAVLKDLQSAESELKWIPVTERLPKKENKLYWVCTDTKYQCECRWTNNICGIGESSEWGWKIFDIPQYTKVVAWMPLPEPIEVKYESL